MKSRFDIEQYNYPLPAKRIAKFPLAQRDQSKLLLWENGDISHHIFHEVPSLLPDGSLLVFNDTRVIAARLLFKKSTGATIEIFLLHPEKPTRDIAESMNLRQESVWSCLIRNKRRWKEDSLKLQCGEQILRASWTDRERNMVKFEWSGGLTFADIVNLAGETPLPPYIRRKVQKEDASRYQTVYSREDGAVAAPTAGLHFTEDLLREIKKKDIRTEYLTLHVSAGTFKPVETEDYRDHAMHREQIVIKRKSIEKLILHADRIIAVGTTSLRILESLYWYGIQLSKNPEASFFISKSMPYNEPSDLTFAESMKILHNFMDSNNLDSLHGETEIFIYPGYRIRSTKGLFTNFHLPKSTLLLLIAAFTGNDWKSIYDEALRHDYRFLSYGDSSLLLRS